MREATEVDGNGVILYAGVFLILQEGLVHGVSVCRSPIPGRVMATCPKFILSLFQAQDSVFSSYLIPRLTDVSSSGLEMKNWEHTSENKPMALECSGA